MKEPKTYVFMVGICLVLLADMLMSLMPSSTTNVLFLRTVQAAMLIGWLFYCRELAWFGLTLPDKRACSIFIKYALVCGCAGLTVIYVWPDMTTMLRLPDIAQGVLGLCLFILIGPLFEELFFRALLYRFLRTVVSVPVAVLLSASLFAMMHGAWLSPQLIGGIIFALAYEQSKNLWVAVALHAAANASIAVLVLY